MPIYRTGMVMAAIITDEEGQLSLLEKLVYRFLRKAGPYRQAIIERWLFGRVATLELYQEGFKNFFVAGAGIPTAGHTHQLVGKECRVLYIDKDPDVVREGSKLLRNFPNARYHCGDLKRWDEEILPVCLDFFGPEPVVGIIMIGLHGFLNPVELKELLGKIYNWAGEGSALIITNPDLATIKQDPNLWRRYRIVSSVYALTGNRLYLKTNAELEELAKPWKVVKAQPFWGWLSGGKTERANIYWGYKLRKCKEVS